MVKQVVPKGVLFYLVVFCLWSPQATAGTDPLVGGSNSATAVFSAEHDPQVDAAFEHFYNLDYDRAILEFEKVLDRRPRDPSAVNHLLSTVLMRELYRMGAMNSGEYANDSFIGEAHRTADPKVKERIKQLVDRAEDWKNSSSRQIRTMLTRSMPAGSRGRSFRCTLRWSSGRGFPPCATPWARGTITSASWNSIPNMWTRSWSWARTTTCWAACRGV